ncbi:MAG: pentapeptide repeat-containing protein, partial [Bacteroidia bacterium]
MKTKKQITKALFLTLLMCFFLSSIYAQKEKKDCKKYNVTELRIDNSTIIVTGGDLIFSDNSAFKMGVLIEDNSNAVAEVVLELIGKDSKGNKRTESFETKLNQKTGFYESTVSLKASYDNGFISSETNCTITNKCGDKTSTTQSFATETTKEGFEIYLNGYKKPVKYGQCWVFARNSGNTNSGDGNIGSNNTGEGNRFVNLGDLSVTHAVTEDKE